MLCNFCVLSVGHSGVFIKQAAGETAFEIWCRVYAPCYQEAGSKVGIYNMAVCGYVLSCTEMPSVISSPQKGTRTEEKTQIRLTFLASCRVTPG